MNDHLLLKELLWCVLWFMKISHSGRFGHKSR